MLLRQLFDSESSTYTYLLADPAARAAALIDPVLEQIDRDLRVIEELGLRLEAVLETHVHADHVTAAGKLRERTGARTYASKGGASCIDVHVGAGDQVRVGGLVLDVLETPGHTDDGLCYRLGGNVFTGDTLLIRGCGRADFQNGDPGSLYDSITGVLFALPDDTVVWPAHDYKGLTQSTIGEEKRHNPRVAGRSRDEFIAIMRGLNLPPPRKLDLAVPANKACGRTEDV